MQRKRCPWPQLNRSLLAGLMSIAILSGCERGSSGTRDANAPGAGAPSAGKGGSTAADLSGGAGEADVPEVNTNELPLGLQTKFGDARYQARRDPNNPNLFVDFGALCYVHGFKPAAVQSFRRAAALKSDDPKLWYYLGLACDELKDAAGAKAAYDKCLRLMDYKFARERLVALGGQPPPSPPPPPAPETQPTTDANAPAGELTRDFWKLELLYRGWHAPTIIEGALRLSARGNFRQAEQMLRDAREADPTGMRTADALGQVYLQQRRIEDAERELELVVASPEDKELLSSRLNLALLMTLRGNYERAEKLLREGVEYSANDPNMNPEFVNALAWILSTTPVEAVRKPEEAVRLAESAAEKTKRQDHRMLDTLAAAYASAGRFEEANKAVAEAIQVGEAKKVPPELLAQYRQRQSMYLAKQAFIAQ